MNKKKTIKTKYYQVRIPGQLCERSLLHRPRLFYECLKFPGFVLQPVEEKNKENLNPLRGLELSVLRATSNYLFKTFLCLDNVVIDSMFTAFRKLWRTVPQRVTVTKIIKIQREIKQTKSTLKNDHKLFLKPKSKAAFVRQKNKVRLKERAETTWLRLAEVEFEAL